MKKLTDPKMMVPLIAGILVVGIYLLCKETLAQSRVSEFGKYQGYSQADYDDTQRISDYMTLSNGTRLAYDLILPTKKGVPADRPLPVLFKYTPYLRTFTIFDKNGKNIIADLYSLSWKERAFLRVRSWFGDRGNLMDPLFRTRWLGDMVKHGYAVIVVERPGTGASFGRLNPSFEAGAREADEILNWIAAQKWCDGKIGMYGESWQAQIQFSAASTGNPHLKAIFPAATWIDNYTGSIYPGGVYNKAFGDFFIWSQNFLNSNVITPVDRDRDGTLLAQARAERRNATVGEKFTDYFKKYPFRDSISPEGHKIWLDSTAGFIDRINRAGIPIYMTAGWYDLYPRDMFILYSHLSVPKRLLVRPLDHSQIYKNQFDLDYGAEAHRWFDYWLKGIKNGIMDEPPIHYYLMGAPKKEAWQITDAWPPKKQEMTRYYFGAGEPGGTASINNGLLHPLSSAEPDSYDTCRVNYSTTTGKNSRWSAVNWAHKYSDMRSNDAKTLTYTTPPLESGLQVTGHPIVHVWLSSDIPDLDVFAYLEEVDGNGNSTYITQGNLRASHRALAQTPYDNLGLPWHNHFQSELEPIPAGKPVELVFDLLPTAYYFSKGNRLRTSIAFADADNFDTPLLAPAPDIRLLRDTDHPSFIQLPVVQTR